MKEQNLFNYVKPRPVVTVFRLQDENPDNMPSPAMPAVPSANEYRGNYIKAIIRVLFSTLLLGLGLVAVFYIISAAGYILGAVFNILIKHPITILMLIGIITGIAISKDKKNAGPKEGEKVDITLDDLDLFD